ncbi:Beta-galactosidase [Fasciola hepatica]|uniref:Beta-galactosidase n=1 Tax=Fasciola hepatica TaxID=6192 RepID=A0A4E0R3I9_FASHE|nr:Beta-galactosidase [Fasciola hepatica]
MWKILTRQSMRLTLLFLLIYMIIFVFVQRRQLEYELEPVHQQLQFSFPVVRSNACITLDQKSNTLTRLGSVFQFIAGQVDYFRIPLEYWEDRLKKAKAAGLDAVEFYIPWNFHERSPKSFDFFAHRNISHYLELVQKVGLLAVVRVGPYICAEWTLGGIPPWLWYQSPNVHLRTSDPAFMRPVTSWFMQLLPILRPYLQENGGPIFMVQIENEYGYHWICDRKYLKMLYRLIRKFLGDKVVYFTVDMPKVEQLTCSAILPDNVLQTIDFGPCDSIEGCEAEQFESLESFRPNGPLVNSEFYTGWFDSWGRIHRHHSLTRLIKSFWSQVNYSNRFKREKLPPLPKNTTKTVYPESTLKPASSNRITHLLWLLSNGTFSVKPLLMESLKQQSIFVPLVMGQKNYLFTTIYLVIQTAFLSLFGFYLEILFHILCSLLNSLIFIHFSHQTTITSFATSALRDPTGTKYEGMMVYVTNIPASQEISRKLRVTAILDAIHIFTNNQFHGFTYHGSAYRGESGQNLTLPYIGKNGTLYILVENRGYVNYGSELSADRKGLMYPVYLDDQLLKNWIMYPLCFNKDGLSCPTTNILDKLTQYPNEWSFARLREMPRMGLVYRGSMKIESPGKLADTFIQLNSFQRGLLYVNSILLGRFDQLRGPQITMFLPKPFLRVGTNCIVIVELSDAVIDGRISFSDKPIWL